MPAHLARPDSIDLPGLGLTIVTSLGITGGRLYTAQHKFEIVLQTLLASDFSFDRTPAADFAPLDCCGLQFVSPASVEVRVKTLGLPLICWIVNFLQLRHSADKELSLKELGTARQLISCENIY